MHNFPFLPTHSCESEAWRSALVNQGFLQQQDPIRPRWRPRGQLGGQAWGIQALCWIPENTKGTIQGKVQRTRDRALRDASTLEDLGENPSHLVLTSGFSLLFHTHKHTHFLCAFFLSDVPIHISFNNLSPKHTQTYPQPSGGVSSQERESLWGRGEGGMLMKSGTGPRNVIRPPHLQERRNRPPNFTMMMSACLHDSVWLRCQVSPLSLCFFFLFPSLPFFTVFTVLCAFLSNPPSSLFSFLFFLLFTEKISCM